MTLTHNVSQQWIDSIREFSAQSITFNHLTYIAEEGRFAIDARMNRNSKMVMSGKAGQGISV